MSPTIACAGSDVLVRWDKAAANAIITAPDGTTIGTCVSGSATVTARRSGDFVLKGAGSQSIRKPFAVQASPGNTLLVVSASCGGLLNGNIGLSGAVTTPETDPKIVATRIATPGRVLTGIVHGDDYVETSLIGTPPAREFPVNGGLYYPESPLHPAESCSSLPPAFGIAIETRCAP